MSDRRKRGRGDKVRPKKCRRQRRQSFDHVSGSRLGIEFLLLVSLDNDVGIWISDAGEHPTRFDLVVIEIGSVGLVDIPGLHFSGAAGARSGAARVGEIDSFFLGLVQDVSVLVTLELLRTVWSDERDLVYRHGGHATAATLDAEERLLASGSQAHSRGLSP